MDSEPTAQTGGRVFTRPKGRVPQPVTTDLSGLIDIDGRFKSALAGWDHLTPDQRRRFNKEVWLAVQSRDRHLAAERRRVAADKQAATAARLSAAADATTAALRSRTCEECFTVRTPAGTCNCTD